MGLLNDTLSSTDLVDLMPGDAHSPQFIDTNACRCALEIVDFHVDEPKAEAWKCIANATQDIYGETTGKWFKPLHDKDRDMDGDVGQPVSWDGNPPDLSQAYVLVEGDGDDSDSFVKLEQVSYGSRLTDDDRECTGRNSTGLSAKYYKYYAHNLCAIAKGVLPFPLGNQSSWKEKGCLPGFFCPNNNDQFPPMQCPPTEDCLRARLTGGFCYPSSGRYEPQVCKEGNYCPLGGKEQIICPRGHYCMDGAIEPIPCSPGASCPEGSDRSLTLLPFGMLVMVNFLMIMWILAARYMSKRRSSRKKRPRSLMGAVRDVQSIVDINQRHKRYGSAVDPDIVLESRISAVKRENTGFLAVVDNDWVGEEFVSQDEKPSTDMQLFVQSMSKCINGASFGLSFEFDDLQFQPKGGNPILSQITGKIDSGALWAIMGASGAGKTTFVNVLMGKIKNTGGITRVNGVAGKISKYKKIIGYVPQDDIVLPELTVRENILHSAKVRLPSSWTDAEVQHHVDVLISCLQLTHVRDSLVGSPAKPVISGGQRKRVSIGIELAAAPMALFLDEPTSGLDATSAASIMQTLKSLSRLGITVVTIIHQPRQEIFESIDNLILLGAGRMIYQGKTSEVASYFNNIGFTFPQNVNPADVLMDIIAGSGRMYKRIGDVGLEALIEHWSGSRNGSSRPSSVEISMTKEDVVALRNSIKSRGAAVHKQIWFCLTRAMLQQARSISSFYFELGVGALSGFLIGLSQMSQRGNNFKGVFYPPFTPLSSAANFSSVAQMALLVGVAIGLTASAPGVRVFGEEKLIYYREAASGHNRFAYYSGKVLSTMPRMILANLHFTVMFLLLSTPQMSFGATFIANFAYFYCVYGLASIVSVLTKREDGPLLAVMASLIVSVLNGMSPRLQQIAEWRLEWLWRLIPGTWLAEAYFDKNVSPWKHLYILDIVTDATGYTLGQFSLDVGILFLLGTAYRVVAFLALRFHNRGQQV